MAPIGRLEPTTNDEILLRQLADQDDILFFMLNLKQQKLITKFLAAAETSGVFGWAKKVLAQEKKAEIFLVGGAVRDCLLEQDTKDFDFVVRGVSAKKLEKILSSLGSVGLVGKNFGVFKFVPREWKRNGAPINNQVSSLYSVARGRHPAPKTNEKKLGTTQDQRGFLVRGDDQKLDALDIALPRTEKSISHSGAYRDFAVQSNYRLPIKKDLSRRDFTINALAIKIFSGCHSGLDPESRKKSYVDPSFRWDDKSNFELIDEFDGLTDLEKGIIKTVGKPQERFQEDYSRMLRGIRLACQLGFKLENQTKKTIKKLMPRINKKQEKSEKQKKRSAGEKNKSLSAIAAGEPSGETGAAKAENFIIAREIIAKEFLRALWEKPARAFDLFDELGVFKALMPEVLKMKKCPQPKNYHSEGNVWKHTRLCLEMLDSPLFQERFKDPITRPIENELAQKKCYDSEVVVAALLHDVDKPTTFKWGKKNGKKKMQYHEHDSLGGKTAEKICERLKLSAPASFGVDAKNVRWLIEKHMLIVGGKVAEMRQTKLEKYFLSEFFPGEKLLQVVFDDAIGTIPDGKKIPQKNSDLKKWISLEGFDIFLKRIKAIKKMGGKKDVRPAPVLNGREVMKILNLPPSKKIGEILEALREAQLNGQIKSQTAAVEFVKKKKI